MKRRNWLQLARKLVDTVDLDFTIASIQQGIGDQSLSFVGEGVQGTTLFPNPFPITMSGASLGGSVGEGQAYDPNGQLTTIGASPDEPVTFTNPTADPTHPRWDLLVLRYKLVGDTPVPKPSDPITTIDLNLHDDFEIFVRPGTPSATPVYPTKQPGDIILAGIQVPATVTLGTLCFVDLTIRELAALNVFMLPVFVDEVPPPIGLSTTNFQLSQQPITPESIVVYINKLKQAPNTYSLAGTVLTLNSPLVGTLNTWYVAGSPRSQNPLALFNRALGIGDGATTTFLIPVGGIPISLDSLEVFNNGLKVPATDYSLLETAGAASIVFNVAPAIAEDLDIVWFVNAAANGIGPGGGGGGSFSRVVFGSFGAPIPINPAVGIVPTADMDQTWWVTPSTSGVHPVTASPQLAAGTHIGQRVTLKGVSGANYLQFDSGTGVSLNGLCNVKDTQSLQVEWDGTQWGENFRRS